MKGLFEIHAFNAAPQLHFVSEGMKGLFEIHTFNAAPQLHFVSEGMKGLRLQCVD